MINRRYLDPLFFLFLMALDVVIWLVTWVLHSTPTYVIILVPTFAAMAVLGLVRALLRWEPRLFWAIMSVASFIFLLFGILAEALMAAVRAYPVELSPSIAFLATAVVSSLLGLFLAGVGAIPASAERHATPKTGGKPRGKKQVSGKKTGGTDRTSHEDRPNRDDPGVDATQVGTSDPEISATPEGN